MDPQIEDQRQQQAGSLHATVEGADCARRFIAWILCSTGWGKWQEIPREFKNEGPRRSVSLCLRTDS
jgi:hypothetical protein